MPGQRYRFTNGLIVVLIFAAGGVACGGASAAAPTPAPETFGGSPTAQLVEVTMPDNLFLPSHVDLQKGGTVRFVFPPLPHNVIFSRTPGEPADIDVRTDTVISRTFSAAGTFPYFCTLHLGMQGVVVVH